MPQINELNNTPTAKFDYTLPPQLANASPDQIIQYQTYVNAKHSLPLFKLRGDSSELEAAIVNYELRMGLQ